MASDKNGMAGILGFLTGAVIGAGLALLFAPQSGEETRKKIKDVSEKMADDVKVNYEKLSKEAKKGIEQIKAAADSAIENVKSFIDGAKDGLKKEISAELKDGSAAPKK